MKPRPLFLPFQLDVPLLDPASYLAALIDGEGSVIYEAPGYVRQLKIVNTDLDIVEAAERAYQALDIRYRRYLTPRLDGRKPIWTLVVCRQTDLRRAAALIPIQSRKMAKLLTAAGSYTRRPNRRVAALKEIA